MQPSGKAIVLGCMTLLAAGALQACRGETEAPEPRAPAVEPIRPPPGAGPTGGEVTLGEPDGPKVRRWMRQRAAEVRRCYETALASNPATRGRLTLRFTIAETGALRGVAATRSTFARRDIPRCVEEVVRGWRTPFRPVEPVEVEYPFSFSPR